MLRLQDAATCNSARSGSAKAAVSCAAAGHEVSDIEGLTMTKDEAMSCLRRDWDVESIHDGIKALETYASAVDGIREQYKRLHLMLREAGASVSLPDQIA